MTCLKPVSYLATSPSLQLLWLLFCEPQPWLHRLESIISWQKMSVFSINNVRWSNIFFFVFLDTFRERLCFELDEIISFFSLIFPTVGKGDRSKNSNFAVYKNNLLMGFTSPFPPTKAKLIFLHRFIKYVKSCVSYENLCLDHSIFETFPEIWSVDIKLMNSIDFHVETPSIVCISTFSLKQKHFHFFL